MTWNDTTDLMLLKELASEVVLQHNQKSIERGAVWLIVAKKLRRSFPGIEVTYRPARDHYKILERKQKMKIAQEERETRTGGDELTEAEGLLEELIEKNKDTERRVEGENEMRKANVEKEKEKAVEIRLRAMERQRREMVEKMLTF